MSANVIGVGPSKSKKQFEVGDQNTKKAEIRDWLKDIFNLEDKMAPIWPSFSHFFCFRENTRST